MDSLTPAAGDTPPEGELFSLVKRLALAFSVTAAVALPAVFFYLNYANLTGHVQTMSQVKADSLAALASGDPEMWKFNYVRMDEMLRRAPVDLTKERITVRDAAGDSFLIVGEHPAAPTLTLSSPVYDFGREVGHVEVTHSYRSMVFGTIVAALLGLLLGVVLYAVSILPLRALRRTAAALAVEQAALRASEEHYRALFERAGEGIVTLAPDGRLVAVNEAFARMHGYSVDEIRAINLNDLDTPKTRHMIGERIQRILSGETLEFEVEHYHKDGHAFPLEVSSGLISSDGEPLIQALHRDISERKQDEQLLREAALQWQSTFDATDDAICMLDAEQRILKCNSAMAALAGGSRESLIGKHCWEVMHGTTGPIPECPMRRTRVSLRREQMELQLRGRWLDFTVDPILGEDGLLQGAVHIVRDVTERKQAEIQRTQFEARLRESQKMEALGTLAGGVAHDFNNALAMINGNVELARQDVGPGHPALESLEEIAKASRRSKDLVQQILAFSRRQTLERKPTSLSMVVLESARLLRASLPAKVNLNVDCKADAPAVLADAAQVKQILLNLCSNAAHAVEARERTGMIEVRLEACTVSEARGALQPGRYACLTVRDNGSGMDEAVRSHLFDPFFTTKEVGQGTGLGLSVVHGIAHAHEASIEVESAPGKGSEFRIYFPEIDAPVAEVTAPSPGGAPVSGAGKHVLYVDDEEAIIFLMQRLLERQGFHVSGYTDPREAVEAVRANPNDFDLAVTDFNMPGMSGLAVASALREIRADLPVVLASGYITEDLRQKAPAAGVRELIYKPNTVDDLCEAVARYANAQIKVAS